eukprot:CAMPEP_0119261536 /NCGR_PEP_ID=MMETSP1329-20130426/1570_1 /TAXON_ID=114041 /ORGANISM="Genus nov. species nov., Strain RCC1024" /LENGTH=970 /DNA_ID=CAMNT_0007261101 /DNA_START=166 /DNA_END=3078 /DNA_ORIENTATION=-
MSTKDGAVRADVESVESAPMVRQIAEARILKGGTVDAGLAALVRDEPGVLVFSRAGCPFCIEVLRMMAARNVPVAVVPDTSADVKAALKAATGQSTFPSVFIKSRHVGGCDGVKKLEATGELEPLLRDLVVTSRVDIGEDAMDARLVPEPRGEASLALLWFPSLVNRWIIQITGIQIVIVAVLCIIFREERWAWWLSAFLLLDFVARFSFGAPASVLGSLSLLVTAPFEQTCLKPQWTPGPPKQFAAFCGICFTTVATCLYFTGHYTAGAVVYGVLTCAASLEGFGNVCVGCIFFQLGVQLGLLPAHVYRIATSTREEQKATWEWKHLDATNKVAPVPSDKGGYTHTVTSDEWKKDDFDVVRHVTVGYFAAPVGLAGCAVALKVASDWAPRWAEEAFEAAGMLGQTADSFLPRDLNFAQDGWWQVFAVAAAALYGLLLLPFIARAVLHPQKVVKEWHCPMRSNGFVLLVAPFVEFAFLIYDVDSGSHLKLARTLWWLGAVPIGCLTALKIGEWLGRSLGVEHVNASWVLVPAANLLVAMVGPVIPIVPINGGGDHSPFSGELFARSSTAVEISSYFYASGAFFSLLMFAITFAAALATPNFTPEALRGQCYAWLTIPTLIGLAYLVLNIARAPDPRPVVSFFADTFYASIALFLGLTAAWLPGRQWLGQDKWHMGYWAATFPLDALACSAAMYYQLSGFEVALVLEVICLVLAVGANVLCLLQMLGGIIRRRGVFTPELFFGPAAFMKLTHEAFRGGLPKLQAALAELDPERPESIRVFAARYSEFRLVHDEHAKHEDEVLFKAFGDLYPDIAADASADHVADAELFAETDALLRGLVESPAAPAVAALRKALSPFLASFDAHLREEENHISPLARKAVPLALQKTLVRQCFELTSAASWERMLPYIVLNCPRHPQRIKYVQALCWAMPERAQQVGAILYRNVDAVMWERLKVSLPDIVPRGVPGYRKMY